MPNGDDTHVDAHAEADAVFQRLAELVGERVESGDREIAVLDVVRAAGLDIDERTLIDLHVPPVVPVYRFLPWDRWFPWPPLFCYWWRRRPPWYECYCPWWWWRCHPYGYPC